MNRTRLSLAAVALAAAAALALGQNADKNTAGPTRNDYRLRVSEPLEGAVISGSTVQVVVNTEIPGEPADSRRTTSSMPRPDVDVFLDGQNRGKLNYENNVMTIDGVAPGEHKLVLLAMNRSGEVIDRKEVRFSSTASVAVATTTETRATQRSSSARVEAGTTAERSTAMTETSTRPEPPPAPAPSSTRPSTLPTTGTAYPSLLVAGAVLALGGLALRRLH